MISYLQAVILGIFQGVAELFPISSLGHTVLLPAVLHWNLDRGSDAFLSFLVLTHFATALVLLAFFWRDWGRILGGLRRSAGARRIAPGDVEARLGWLLIASTVPAGLLGLALEHRLQALFANASVVAVALILNGGVLLAAERLRDRTVAEGPHDDAQLARLGWGQALAIGGAQALALIPGFSRTGVTMTGGLLSGLSHENAVRYSFLLATPIIFAAALLKLPALVLHGAGLGPALIGALCAAGSAWASVRFLVRYFETRTLTPFAFYCVVAGVVALALIQL